MYPKLLLVESDTLALNAMKRHLSDRYAVTTAASASEALQVFGDTAEIDIVATQVELNDGSGILLATELAKTSPETPLVLFSERGCDDPRILNLPNVRLCMCMPFSIAKLHDALEGLLENSG